MMISLKWKIQAWHAVISGVTLSVLGVAFYYIEREHTLNEIDFTLDQTMHPIIRASSSMNNRGRGGGTRRQGGDQEGRSRRGGEDRRGDGRRGEERGEGRGERSGSAYAVIPDAPLTDGWEVDNRAFVPGSNQSPGDVLSETGPFLSVESRLAHLGFYCIAWDGRTGEVIYRSENAPVMESSPQARGYLKRIRDGHYREMFYGNPTAPVLVGFDLESVYADLNWLKWKIAGVLLAVFALGLLVGGWFVSRSLAPFGVIERTTSAIARGKLKERIPDGAGGNTTELVHLTHDLNDTFAKLDALFEQQIRFTADASHELRTPLTALIAQMELGRKRKRSVEEHEDILEVCDRSVRRIKRITDDLLELTHYDSGRFKLEIERLPLDQLMDSLAEDLTPIVEGKGSQLQLDLQPVSAPCDPFRLEQVVTNLMNNAMHHNPGPIRITLRTSAENGLARIDVIDNGKGIQPENLQRLFDRFFQENHSRTTGRSLNVGLGLAISRAIIEAHHGTLSVTSTPGVETMFSIRLPIENDGLEEDD